MRLWLLVVVVVVTACDRQDGAYIEVEGGVAFDRIEFHFGKELGARIPSSPQHLTTDPGVLYKRLFAEPDVQATNGRTRARTYYLPPNSDNDHVGDYLVVVAYTGDVAVGIGELTNFGVPAHEVWLFHIELVDPSNEDAEVWGTDAARCVRWTRVRGDDADPSTLAVVHPDDRDCDGLADGIDCDVLDYCGDPTTCIGKSGCLLEATCEIGACTNRRGVATAMPCAPIACLSPAACQYCRGNAMGFLPCLMTAPFGHSEIDIPRLNPSKALCSPKYSFSFSLTGGKPCIAPRIELPVNGLAADMFQIDVAPDATGACRFTLTEPSAGAAYVGNNHIVLSIVDSASATGRSTLVLGLRPTDRLCNQGILVVPFTPPDYGICN